MYLDRARQSAAMTLARIFRDLGVGDRFAARWPVTALIVPGGHDSATALGRVAGSTGRSGFLGRRDGGRGSVSRGGREAGDRGAAGEDELGPGVAGGQVQHEPAGVAGESRRRWRTAAAAAVWVPSAGRDGR